MLTGQSTQQHIHYKLIDEAKKNYPRPIYPLAKLLINWALNICSRSASALVWRRRLGRGNSDRGIISFFLPSFLFFQQIQEQIWEIESRLTKTRVAISKKLTTSSIFIIREVRQKQSWLWMYVLKMVKRCLLFLGVSRARFINSHLKLGAGEM